MLCCEECPATDVHFVLLCVKHGVTIKIAYVTLNTCFDLYRKHGVIKDNARIPVTSNQLHKSRSLQYMKFC